MASDDYTPTTARMRREYLESIADRGFADLYAAEWDRWLAGVIREAKAEGGAEALKAAADAYPESVMHFHGGTSSDINGHIRVWLRARAAALREGGDQS